MAFPAQFDLSSLNGTNGFTVNGINVEDRSGRSVSRAGDVNGDGIDDFIIGASDADPNGSYSGESYVVFGRRNGFDRALDLSALDGSNGFVLNGVDGIDVSGLSVSDAGDVNGDGIDDVIIGAFRADPNEQSDAGSSYVVFGSRDGFDASFELSGLNGINGFIINGIARNDYSGRSVSSAGDVNGDGFDDVIIGANRADPNNAVDSGTSYIVFGSQNRVSGSLNLSDLNGENGFAINGVRTDDRVGQSVSSAGDVNGDGIDDVIIGADDVSRNGQNAVGASYVVFGRRDGFESAFNLSDLNGSNGFTIAGIAQFDQSGYSVSSAGDVNGDGIDDVIIGSDGATTGNNPVGAGASYVVFGRSNGFAAQVNLSELNGANGFLINGIDGLDVAGRSVSGAGDINGDGFDDVIIGAVYADPNSQTNAGESYIVFGRGTGFDAQINLADLNGTNGFVIRGIDPGDFSGNSVSGAGDVNGDGVDDVIIAARLGDPNDIFNAGETYVIYGQKAGSSGGDRIDGTPEADLLGGTSGNDTISGRAMNDTLQGLAGNDLLIGGSGNDSLVGGIGNDRLIGGGGADTLEGGEGQDRFSFQSIRQGIDSIFDFNGVDDLVLLKQTGFDLDLPKGRLTSDRFTIGSAARDRGDRVIYNDQTGALLIDLDGRGGRDAVAIAVLSPGLELSAANFRII